MSRRRTAAVADGVRRRPLGFESLEPRLALDASLLRITELSAANDSGIVDADGEHSDWVEIYNPGAQTADLSGMYLTDAGSDLEQWQFPAGTTLAPGGYLVVFASDKDGVLAGGELHTNFKLSADGEFLGLVAADGVTIVDQYGPEFPFQLEDISYGRAMQSAGVATTIVAASAAKRAIVPTSDALGVSWTLPDFVDAAWPISGVSGVGYESSPGDPVNFTSELGTLVPAGTTTAFVRITFNLASLEGVDELRLRMKYDDGFVAYINGVEVASINAEEPYSFQSIAGAIHPDPAALIYETFDASRGIPALRVGTNVLAIHALNLANSTDMLMKPELVAQPKALAVPEQIGYFVEPTPGYGNGAAVAGFTAEPTFSVPHGFYNAAQSVALSTATAGATIIYTTNGSAPTVSASGVVTNGTIYTGPIAVAGTTTLRARAFKASFETSTVAASTYLFVDDIVGQSPLGQAPAGWPAASVNGQRLDYGIDPDIIALYGSQAVKSSLASIPAVSVTTDLANLFDPATGIYVNAGNRGISWERHASVELINPDGSPGFDVNAGLRIRGGFSRQPGNPKHSFRLYFRGEYGDGRLEFPLFGAEGAEDFDKLDLRSEQNYSWHYESGDRNTQTTFIREAYGRDLQGAMGQPHSRSNYVHLFLNGQYWGLYQTYERPEEDFAASYGGGVSEDYDIVKSGYYTVAGSGTEISSGNAAAWTQLFNYGQALATNPVANANVYWTMQGKNPDGSRNPSLPVLLDVENLADYMLTIIYTGGWDVALAKGLNNNIGNNWYGSYNRVAADEGFQFYIYDNEHSMGTDGTVHGSLFEDRTGPFNNGNQNSLFYFNPQFLHQDLLASVEYKQAFIDRVQQHMFNSGPLTMQNGLAAFLERVAQVDPAVISEAARWGDAQGVVPRNKTTWQNEINWITNTWFPTRTGTVLTQLRGDGLYTTFAAPAFSKHGGVVPTNYPLGITFSGGTVYYTTDGVTDPRAIGGAVNSSPAVSAYSGAIAITEPVTVRARLRTVAGAWSGLVEATFTPVPFAGDFNGSGTVNASDLAVWRVSYGASVAPGVSADGTGDGQVDGADFLVWQRHVGAVFPSAAPSAVTAAAAPLAVASATGNRDSAGAGFGLSPAMAGGAPAALPPLMAPTSWADEPEARRAGPREAGLGGKGSTPAARSAAPAPTSSHWSEGEASPRRARLAASSAAADALHGSTGSSWRGLNDELLTLLADEQ